MRVTTTSRQRTTKGEIEMQTIDLHGVACSAISDCCEFNPHFVGVDFTQPAIIDLIDESLRYAESLLCDCGAYELFSQCRLEVIATLLVCSTEDAERRYSLQKAQNGE